jgi:hypothetical protein
LLGKTMRITGTPDQIADRLEEWAATGVDGVNLMYSTTPGTFVDFIDYVAPDLQRRGLVQHEYRLGIFREKLFGAGPYLPERHVARSYRYCGVQPKDRSPLSRSNSAVSNAETRKARQRASRGN